MTSADSKDWRAAMLDEMNSLKDNNTFSLTTLPEGRKSGGEMVVHYQGYPRQR